MTAANSNVLSYTPANRLASASGAWGNKAYSYDGVGNRITDVTTGGASISRTQYYSNTSNRLNDIWENGAQLRVYTYDGAGNTLTETRPGEAFAYTYNKRNRLASVTRNGSLWGAYVYNAFEQLVSRTSPAPAAPLGTVHYIHDLDGHLIAEADGATGATLRDYIWLPANDNDVQDLPLAVIDGVNTATPVTSFIHTDHLGRPTRMTNAAKATVWQAVWTPWGEAQSMTGSVTQNLRFPGQYFQIETGLNYNHHRTYDPVTGRYTQPDPLGFVDGPSVYAYAGNSPWMNVDRSGLDLSMTLVREERRLYVLDNSSFKSLIIENVVSGNGECTNNPLCDAIKDVGPVPTGDYLIGGGVVKRGHRGDDYWFPLYGRNGKGGYEKNNILVIDPATGEKNIRNGMYIHTGRASNGCVTVWSDVERTDPDYPTSKAYDQLKEMLRSTEPFEYKPGDTYLGRLYVR